MQPDSEPSTGQQANGAAMPRAEVDIDEALVQRLLNDQHPDLAGLTVAELANGWDNVLFRLGPELMVRLPRRSVAAALVEHEQRWLPEIDAGLPLPVPTPLRVGRATGYYPWSWSVIPWFEGTAVGLHVPVGQPGEAMAGDLGRFLAALHRPAPNDTPANPSRGGPLSVRDDMTVRRIDQLARPLAAAGIDGDRLRELWAESVSAPRWDGPPLWLHGDLHPFNLVMSNRALRAVIDFGDITAGDPATDLAVGFSLFTPDLRARFRTEAANGHRPIDDAMWLRARGWSLSVGAAIAANSADNPTMFRLGMRMLARSAGAP
jgi:aminoglycoside phosphotransferase (APT) family kinase protein